MAWASFVAFVWGQKLGYQQANVIRAQILALAALRTIVARGGWREGGGNSLNSASWVAVPAPTFQIDGTVSAGLTYRLRVWLRSMDAGTSITFRLKNVTDGTFPTLSPVAAAVTATDADYSGTNQIQVVTFTPTAGAKYYEVQFQNSDAVNDGYIEYVVEAYGS